ncbi:MAG: 16S rRNA (guanine(527)-N(7))-methyltransferase RsmG [Oligoflexia bacterium]|nr:16S rRNA (guanine(527)-N(7))-methyltransferase RsmG [Oligoflexia bacterium]
MFNITHLFTLKNLLNPLQIEKMEIYARELFHFNKSISLYSRRQKPGFCWEMILDSLVAGPILLKDSTQPLIADIGSGAGFPGIVLSVLAPKREFWLFESNKKKSCFLEYICWKLSLSNVHVKNKKVEQSETLLNCAVSKAFFSLGKRLDLTQSIFRTGACYYHLQSSNWEAQWKKAPVPIQKNWSIELVGKYSYPPWFTDRALLKTIFKGEVKKVVGPEQVLTT